MQNTKVLEMLNNGQIEELKLQLQDEIYTESLKGTPGAKQRYAAMKKYFKYAVSIEDTLWQKPCVVNYDGEKYISFTNNRSLILTKESNGEIEMFENSEEYLEVEKLISFDGTKGEISFTKVIADAKSKGYRLKKSETYGKSAKYFLYYGESYYAIGLLDAAYSIINDGENATVWHSKTNKRAPLVIRNDIGICLVCPTNLKSIDKATVIDWNNIAG